MTFASRDPLTRYYPDRQWTTTFTHLNHEFADGGERTLDARTMSLYHFTGITPAMASPKLGQGAAYVYTARDGKGEWLDGSKNYKVPSTRRRSRCRRTARTHGREHVGLGLEPVLTLIVKGATPFGDLRPAAG